MEHTTHPVALVTGASRGIGKAIALALAQDGYKLCLLARSKDKLEETARAIKALDINPAVEPEYYVADITDKHRINEVVSEIIEKNNRIDVLVNNAGKGAVGTTDMPLDTFKELVDINLIGAFNVARLVAKQMIQQKSGYIFNVASMSGKRALAVVGGYAASKFGLVGLNEALFEELAPHNIKVTAICPATVATEMSANITWLTEEEKIQVEDIVKSVRYLLQLSPSALVKEQLIYCRKAFLGSPKT